MTKLRPSQNSFIAYRKFKEYFGFELGIAGTIAVVKSLFVKAISVERAIRDEK